MNKFINSVRKVCIFADMKIVTIIRAGFWAVLLLGVVLLGSCTPDDSNNKQVDKNQLLELVNSYRTSGCNCGSEGYFAPTTPVVWSTAIALTALDHSEDMNKKNFFSHTGSDGSDVGTRLRRRNYDWRMCGENIASGYKNEASVVEGWINSPGHCKNIMSPGFEEMGVARVGDYWTQVFGAHK